MSDLNRRIKHWLGTAAGVTGLYERSFGSKMFIVTFHRVDDVLAAGPMTCSSETFRDFCNFFKRYFDVVPLREQVAASRAGRPMGGTLSITFDDGYLDNFQVAAPLLKDLGLHATFFVTSSFIESHQVPFWDKDLPEPPTWMSWDQVRALAKDRFDIGCHTHTHIDMGNAPAEQIRVELQTSKRIIEQQVSQPIQLFAYPFGGRKNIREESLQLVRDAGFDCCVSCCGGCNDSVADTFRLNRVPISDWFLSPHQMGAELVLGRT